MIYETVYIFNDNCPSGYENARLFHFVNENPEAEIKNNWQAQLFPNPTTNDIYITTNKESEDLQVIITDVTGKLCENYSLKTLAFISSIKLSLNDGIYFVTIINNNNERTVKKLVISK